jgi:transposase
LTPKLKILGVKMKFKHQIKEAPLEPKIIRHFSDAFKKSIVKDIETKKLTKRDVSKLYEVSETAVYKWIIKYSKHYQKGVHMVLELESEGNRLEYFIKKLKEAEQIVGKKQIEIEFLNKVIELCSDELGYDVKKKYITTQSSQ